jgi:hypothetical protein
MTFVLAGLAVVLVLVTLAAAGGLVTVSFEEPTAKQAVRRARLRRQIIRETLAVFSAAAPTAGLGPPPLFESAETATDEADPAVQPEWRPTPPIPPGPGQPPAFEA